jgi:hypothetical protein
MRSTWMLPVLALAVVACGDDSTSDSTEASLPPLVTVPGPPVPADMAAQAALAGVPVAGEEAFETHTHTYVLVYVDGELVGVPAGLGIAADGSSIAALHTHAEDQLFHVESPNENDEYTVGQALQMWGIEPTQESVCQAFAAVATCDVAVSAAELDDPAAPPTEAATSPVDDGLEHVLEDRHVVVLDITA